MDMEKAVNIVGYDRSKGTLANDMKTVSGAHAYDNPTSGKTVIIVVHQVIHVPTMECNLNCSTQVRMIDAKLDDKPKFLMQYPTDEAHAISCEEKNSRSPFILISSLQRCTTLLTLVLSFLKTACLHVSFTAYENFYKLSKMNCLLILFSTFSPSEVSENRNPTIKHISTYTLFHPSISTYVVDHFLVISCL